MREDSVLETKMTKKLGHVDSISLFCAPESCASVMDTETNRLKAKLSTLNESLDGIEAQLESLLAQTLPETIVGLETMQQAKLQVVLPYVVYDLVFSAYSIIYHLPNSQNNLWSVYLKAKGIDPKSHPVVAELVNL
jgi:exosome complex protein LRP1